MRGASSLSNGPHDPYWSLLHLNSTLDTLGTASLLLNVETPCLSVGGWRRQTEDSGPAKIMGRDERRANSKDEVERTEQEYKFQRLRVYHLALDYIDAIYELGKSLPESERYNLRSQLERAATSIALNIAEGSTGQSDAEQGRFLGLAARSFFETVACLDIISRRGYVEANGLRAVRTQGRDLFVKLQAFRRTLR